MISRLAALAATFVSYPTLEAAARRRTARRAARLARAGPSPAAGATDADAAHSPAAAGAPAGGALGAGCDASVRDAPSRDASTPRRALRALDPNTLRSREAVTKAADAAAADAAADGHDVQPTTGGFVQYVHKYVVKSSTTDLVQ